ncbi:hypothetical protein GCM10027566_23020 [Arachidicoccus ginsenosidivorans]|uniref:Lipocalin-like domain-containing protein n=1 Tax=Arachidicoccus ginsenosidivorans TaxID=496057 RepID=A0A5B8VI22_9BACT|nr:hypothetical protein [Arachidicoccus ginsenosidivorans]QEC71237.1 hypothetical protein FSB73_05670 [Arachidicoccus ginsenosidivorans]
MRHLNFLFLAIFIVLCLYSCKKGSNPSPSEILKSPVGTWVLTKRGVQAGDGTKVNWQWTDVTPMEAYKVTFGENNNFVSYEKKPPINGSFSFSNDSIQVFLPEDGLPKGRIMKGELKNNIITLRFLLGADGASGLQFRFINQN